MSDKKVNDDVNVDVNVDGERLCSVEGCSNLKRIWSVEGCTVSTEYCNKHRGKHVCTPECMPNLTWCDLHSVMYEEDGRCNRCAYDNEHVYNL